MIYLDNAATTACSPEVVSAMLPFFSDIYANASSIDHAAGTRARQAVEAARSSVAALLSAKAEDVIFTSGSTESNNLLFSIDSAILTTPIEHPSILEPFRSKAQAVDNVISVDANGIVSLSHLKELLQTNRTRCVVSVIGTNNEIGTEQDLTAISEVCESYNALLHIDATQMIGTKQVDIARTPISGVSLSAHKVHGPKGVGALVAKGTLRRLLNPVSLGGGQERSLRSGTLNVPGIVGFGAAAGLLAANVTLYREHLTKLREVFLATLKTEAGTPIFETVPPALVSPHILSLRFEGVNGRALLGAVGNEACFSLGAACATNKSEPSPVLLALGFGKADIAQTVRFSFSRDQQIDEVVYAAKLIGSAASRLAGLSLA